MSFLQPIILAGLPLIALPIIIHLINRQRHRTKRWAAMMFLLSAKRMTRGMARLRQLLIMLMRMLAVAGLIFAVSRPLASGWLGIAAGGRPNTVIILLDRSASMEQIDPNARKSKRETGLEKLSGLAETFGSTTRVVLIESTNIQARELNSPDELKIFADSSKTSPDIRATDTTTDIPAMLQAASDYIAANQTGRTDVWLCSDSRESDWDAESGRWSVFRESMREREGVRFYLLNYADAATDNVSVWVDNVRRRKIGEEAELVLDIHLRRTVEESDDPDAELAPLELQLQISIDGRSHAEPITMLESEYSLQGHTIRVEQESGWGSVELPSDSGPQDNVYYFAYSKSPEHRTIVVSDDSPTAAPMRMATAAPVEPSIVYDSKIISPDELSEIDWDTTALIVWQAELPDETTARQLEDFVAKGRSIVFFPPEQPNGNTAFGVQWKEWESAQSNSPLMVDTWRDNSDLLQNSLSGAALPVGDLKTYQYCALEGEGTSLARLADGRPLLLRAETNAGAAYFFGTLPRASHSSLARDGVVFYVMMQRSLTAGASALGQARQLTAGSIGLEELTGWQSKSVDENVLSSERANRGGVYEKEDRWMALNRPASEDSEKTVSSEKVAELFGSLDHQLVDDQLGSAMALASEVWRSFLVAMAIALLAEAILCLPPLKKQEVVAGQA